MRKFLLFLILWFLNVHPLIAIEHEQIKIVYHGDAAPLIFEDEAKKAAGLFADKCRLWSNKVNKKIKFIKAKSFQDSLNLVMNGKVHLHAGLSKNQKLKGFLSYSKPLLTLAEQRQYKSRWIVKNLRVIKPNEPNTKGKPLKLTSNEKAFIRSHQPLVFSEVNWKPLSITDNPKKYDGMIADYFNIISERSGLRFQFQKSSTWAEVLQKYDNKKIDVVPAIDKKNEVKREINLSKPFATFPLVIVTRNDVSYIKDSSELKGKKVAVGKGYTSCNFLKDNYPDIHLVQTDDVEQALIMLANGRVFAFVGHMAVAIDNLQKLGMKNLKIAGKTEFRFDHKIGIDPKYPEAVSIINKVLSSMTEHEHRTIYQNWLKVKYQKDTDYGLLWKILVACLVFFSFIVFWNRKLTIVNRELNNEIAERQKSEKARQKSEKRFRSLVDNLQGVVYRCALDERFTMFYISDMVLPLTGYKSEDFINNRKKSFADIYHSEDKERVQLATMTAIAKKKPFEIEYRIITANGKIRWVFEKGTAVCENENDYTPAWLDGVLFDITERKQMETELVKAKEDAEKATKAKSEFLANMSHEIRTPMNAVLGFTEILLGKINDEQLKQYLSTISSSGKTLLVLINDILDLSKVEAGKLQLEYSEFNPYTIFQELETLFSKKIAAKSLNLIMDIDPLLPRLILLDETRLRQILLNLISNAVKFTDRGYIKLCVSSKYTDQSKKQIDLFLTVEDTGIGIPEEQQENIFNTFEQKTGQSHSQFGGTGLGLAITKRLINLMKGDINLKSQVNKGSSFTVTIKNVEIISNLNITNTETDTETDTDTDIHTIRFDKATVLLIDDIKNNRDLVKLYLENYNLTIIEAENGLDGIELSQLYQPDIILMDLKMPVMDGYEATKKIKENQNLKSIPVIALSASSMKHSETIISTLCDGFLKKPVKQKSLILELSKFLRYSNAELSNSGVNPSQNSRQQDSSSMKLADDILAKAPQLIELLEGNLMDHWQKINNKLIFDEIEEFAYQIKKLIGEFHITMLEDWVNNLIKQVEIFDVDAISMTLKLYPNIIDNIKKLTEHSHD